MNTFKANTKKSNGVSLARVLVDFLNGSFLTRESVLKQVPYLLFLVFIMFIYIGYGYYAEKTVRKVYKMDTEVKELKSKYTSTFSRLETKKQQSNVAETVSNLGLVESRVPPFKIVVEE
ncbi:FtsL-like putative cell division protein [Luteibaculum oceani]|uniref:S-adenosyl-methyltransferase n=1 Tax=Luteibaculum oceani TaxID=1294296 RepID=A0A5C6V241_9FLAO|nr:FtsL-like putative cell division protein [Luteibaculum oceani]TXC78880.1 hypothetical protein FRX97_06610 [Luteibaculum oceani]